MVHGGEQARLSGPDADAWRRWGPYLSERAWGTVREDYSADGDAWGFFPHDHARSRTYRWNEDGLAGLSDDGQHLCFALALWNGADPILKERAFGLTGPQGNHGEDVKEYFWFLDSTPTHSWMRWRYVYPQRAYPYQQLLDVSAGRSRTQMEYELLDTGVFDEDRYFDVTVDYAKASPDDVCLRISVTNAGPDAATLHLLPTLWFRDTWSWTGEASPAVPVLRSGPAGALLAEHDALGPMVLASDGSPTPLFCDNATNTARLWPGSGATGPAYPKDGINDHVVTGAATVNPGGTGTKAALHHVLTLAPGATHVVRLRLAPGDAAGDLAAGWEETMATRQAEAQEFYAQVCDGATPEEAHVVRAAFAGMLWGKQYYAYRVRTWLDGDPGQPVPPAARRTGRNSSWPHFDAHAVVSMPDPWEYPWFAAWDLAFHCVTLAHVDPGFAKAQLSLVLGDGWMHPGGQVPAYEWDFGAVNPPVHAWAALTVFQIDGGTDTAWLRQVFERLLVNHTWWVTRFDPDGNGLFAGGFLGMDNVGPFDRNAVLPEGFTLEQADATGWMALFTLSMLQIAATLSVGEPTLADMTLMFFEHFTLVAQANDAGGLWDERDAFAYDRVVRDADGARWPVALRSMSGLVQLFAVITLEPAQLAGLPQLRERAEQFLAEQAGAAAASDVAVGPATTGEAGQGADARPGLVALVDRGRVARMMRWVSDEAEFLSPHGVRSVSAVYRGNPYTFHGMIEDDTAIDYEPAESTTALFGGNSNWRGPVWMPVNVLLVDALRRYGQALGADVTVEHPLRSGRQLGLRAVADDLTDRLVGLYLPDASGHRPVWGGTARLRDDPRWRDDLLFFEYFHGDDGAGLGASHQTGWTGLVANLLLQRIADRRSS